MKARYKKEIENIIKKLTEEEKKEINEKVKDIDKLSNNALVFFSICIAGELNRRKYEKK